MREWLKRISHGHLALFLLLFGIAMPAYAANPELIARVGGVESDATRRSSLRIETMEVRVRLHGTIAETSITARFANPSSEILEGDFTLAMPAGSVVTGYALDINGAMMDGVLVDQRQARLAYEARVRQRIDPGLAEVGRDNLFRTRVFPIFPGSGRTIRLRIATPLDPVRGYVLPLETSVPIGTLTMDIQASGVSAAPTLALPPGLNGRWQSDGGLHRLNLRATAVKLDGALSITGVTPAGTMLTSRHPGEDRFFQIADTAPAAPTRRVEAGSVAILWDRSLSRRDDGLDEEIAVVRQYLEQVRPRTIELILFDSSGVERVRAADAADAARRLGGVRYRGASSLAVLARENLDADACLLFSDGLVTIDRRDAFRPGCPLFAVSSAADADRAYLGSLARSTGGEAYDLTTREAGEILTRMTRAVPRVIDVRTSSGAAVDYTLLDGGERGWRIVGRLPAGGDVLVRLAGIGPGITERLYTASSQTEPELSGPGALWASERVEVQSSDDDHDRAAVIRLARRYSVASTTISFVVLETANDYAMAEIAPPATFPKELRDQYEMMRADIQRRQNEEKRNRLSQVLAQWDAQRRWWETSFNPNAKVTDGNAAADSVGRGRGVRPQSPPPPPPPSSPPPPPPVVVNTAPATEESMVVTGSRVSAFVQQTSPLALRSDVAGRAGSIEMADWSPDRPYLAALDAARNDRIDAIFAEQQARHGALPAFWLDTAEWHFRKGWRDEAVALVMSALELPTRDSQTLSVVADRLVRYGQVDRAIWLYERLVAAEPDRPQPKRTLALTLAKRAESLSGESARTDLARAISLLTDVVMTPWDSRYNGIEMISLMEVNRLIPLYRAMGGRDVPLDPRLIALLDVDVRVVIEWNTEATDIDLWVDEPNGERAIYHNPRTAIGGHLSDDMTAGYGPEEYLLRRAPTGAFIVRANVFASDRINPNGASQVTARLIRNFGRRDEQEEVVDIELLPGTSGERLIGEIRIRR